MIVDYVRKKNEDYFRMEKDYTRTESLSAREDPRVSVPLTMPDMKAPLSRQVS
jgi:hypothetical protein